VSEQAHVAAPAPEVPRKRRFGVTTITVGIVLFILIVLGGGDWMVQIPFYLVFGWFGFLRENLAALEPNPRLIVEALLCVAALGVGSHYFCRWLYAAMAPDAAVAWRARWTALGVGLLFLLFAAGIGTIGLTHQAAWLIGAKEPMFRDEFTDRARVSEAVLAASALRTEVTEEFARTGRLLDTAVTQPVSDTPRSIVESVSLAKGGVVTVVVKQEFKGGGTVTFTPSVVHGKLEWKCSSTLPNKMLPGMCRK
jgi:hypothetical protein